MNSILKPIINVSSYVTGTLGSVKGTIMNKVSSIKNMFISKAALGPIKENAVINIMETPRYNTMSVVENFVYYKAALINNLIEDIKKELLDAGANLATIGNHAVLLALFLSTNKFIFDIVSFAYINNVDVTMLLKYHVYSQIGSIKILCSATVVKLIFKYVFGSYISIAKFINIVVGSAIAITTCSTIHGSYNSAIEGILAITRLLKNGSTIIKKSFRTAYAFGTIIFG